MSELLQVSNATSTSSSPTTSSAFKVKQTLSWSVHKTGRSLYCSPCKETEVIGTLAKKFNLRIALHNKSEGKKNELNGVEEEWSENSLEGSDITYKTPGRRNTVYFGMYGDKREYKHKGYLLWKLRDLSTIINGSNSMKCSFSNYTTSSKCIRRLLTIVKSHTLPVYWSLQKRFTFSERNKFKSEVKWYIIVYC